MREGNTTCAHPWVVEGRERVRFGLAYGPRVDWLECRDVVQMAEELGFDSYWAMDHPISGMDCWSLLSALSVTTDKIRLGTLVSCIFYRPTIALARVAADIDRLSGGRFILGIGIGDHQYEFHRMGLPFPPAQERQRALKETIELIQELWSGNRCTYEGVFARTYQLELCARPVQQPYIPILIAGGGERTTLKYVAQYADMSNFGAHQWAGSAFTREDIQRKYAVLHQYCEEAGRPYSNILRSYASTPVVLAETRQALEAKLQAIPEPIRRQFATSILAGTPGDILAHCRMLVDAGVRYFIAGIFGNDQETVRLFAHYVIPAFSEGTPLPDPS